MGTTSVGDALWAVMNPPELARFRVLTGVGDAPLSVNFTGWNKYVVLSDECVFLFPRREINVEWFTRELAVYHSLEASGLAVVPRVVAEWSDDAVYPFPFAAVTRLRGEHPVDATHLFAPLGRSIAGWHDLAPPDLPGARHPAHHDRPEQRWLRRALDAPTAAAAATEAADLLGVHDRLALWSERLEAAARHRHVLVHGDIHESQLLAVGTELTGVLDWETARIDHPFWDFDLGEWGTGLWRVHRSEFARLWTVAWEAYANARGLDTDAAPLQTAFRLRHAIALLEDDRDPALVGTIEEHLAAIG
jgi:aminoglycoside phosphotransferase (APT) family kinase protein